MSEESELQEAQNDQLALDEAELEWRSEQLAAGVRTGFDSIRNFDNFDETSEGHWITLRITFLKKRIERIKKALRKSAEFKNWEKKSLGRPELGEMNGSCIPLN